MPSSPAWLRDVLESAVAQIVVEDVSVHAGDENVRVAVIVEVRDGNGHGIAASRQSGAVGHIGEMTIAVVLEQSVVKLRLAFVQGRRGGAVGEEDVHAPVAIEVERSHAAGHQLDLMESSARAVIQSELQTGLFELYLRTESARPEPGN